MTGFAEGRPGLAPLSGVKYRHRLFAKRFPTGESGWRAAPRTAMQLLLRIIGLYAFNSVITGSFETDQQLYVATVTCNHRLSEALPPFVPVETLPFCQNLLTS